MAAGWRGEEPSPGSSPLTTGEPWSVNIVTQLEEGSLWPPVSQILRAAPRGWGAYDVPVGTMPATKEDSSEKGRCGPPIAALLAGEVPPVRIRGATG